MDETEIQATIRNEDKGQRAERFFRENLIRREILPYVEFCNRNKLSNETIRNFIAEKADFQKIQPKHLTESNRSSRPMPGKYLYKSGRV